MKHLIFSFVLLISFSTNEFFSQIQNLSDENKRSLIIGIINKTQSLESSINAQRSMSIKSKFKISNDLKWSNKPDTFLLYKDYLKLIKSKSLNYSTRFFINNINQSKFSNNTIFTDVYVNRIIEEDTISQKLEFSSVINNPRSLKIIKISSLNNLGRVIKLDVSGDKDYFKRYGSEFDFKDSSYNIPTSYQEKDIYYKIKDLNKPLDFSKKSYPNYHKMFQELKPLDSSMARIAIIKHKVGRYGYFEIDGGKDVFNNINSSFESDLLIEDAQISFGIQNNWNSSIKYNIYLPSPFRAYFGIGVFSNNFSFNTGFNNFNQSYVDVDPDGANYQRIISYANFQESLVAEFISTSITMGLNLELNNISKPKNKKFMNFLLLLDLNYSGGIMSNINTKSNRKSDMLYSGYYENLFNLNISDNGVYDFGNYTVSNGEELPLKNNFSHNISIGLKSYFNRLVFSTSFNYLWIQNNLFDLEENSFLSTNNQSLNSYFSSIEKSKISMFSINFKVGLVLIKKRNEKF